MDSGTEVKPIELQLTKLEYYSLSLELNSQLDITLKYIALMFF